MPDRVAALCGTSAPRIFIKRDDLTSIALGGNKLRNLEFRLARAMAEDPDTVIVGLDLLTDNQALSRLGGDLQANQRNSSMRIPNWPT